MDTVETIGTFGINAPVTAETNRLSDMEFALVFVEISLFSVLVKPFLSVIVAEVNGKMVFVCVVCSCDGDAVRFAYVVEIDGVVIIVLVVRLVGIAVFLMTEDVVNSVVAVEDGVTTTVEDNVNMLLSMLTFVVLTLLLVGEKDDPENKEMSAIKNKGK